MPSTLVIPAQFMTPWSGPVSPYSASAEILADTDSDPQRIVNRFSGNTDQVTSFGYWIPPGLTNMITGSITWIPESTGSVHWQSRERIHPTPWLVSHFTFQSLNIEPSVEPGKLYSTPLVPENFVGGITAMSGVAVELGRYATSDTCTGNVDLLYFTMEFDDTPGARNAYFWVPMNGVYNSIGSSTIGYYNQNGFWYRDFPSSDTAVDFQISVPSDLYDAKRLYIRYQSNSAEPAGASGYWEVYVSITNPCIDYDQDFTLAGTGSLRSDYGTGTPNYYIYIDLDTDLQAGDQATFRLKRVGDDARDTFTGTQRIFGCYLLYEKSSFTQSFVIPLTNLLGTAENVLVPTVESSSYHWVGRYLPTVTTYLDLPITQVTPSYLSTPVVKIRWITRDNLTGRVSWKLSVADAPMGGEFTYGSDYTKVANVRGDYILHETAITLTGFSPERRDAFAIKLTRDGSDLTDTFYGTVEVLDVVVDYIASTS